MEKLILLSVCFIAMLNADAQIVDPAYRARRAAENRVNNKIDQGINKGMDKAEEGIGNIFKKKKKDNSQDSQNNSGESDSGKQQNSDGEGNSGSGFSSTGKFDFVPGEKIIVYEDFSQDVQGDFPAKWNTNGSGELVKLNNNKSKFLRTSKAAIFYPEYINGLPDNFTVEYDLSSTPEFSYYSGYLVTGFTSEANIGKRWNSFSKYGDGDRKGTKSTVEVFLHPTSAGGNRGMTMIQTFGGGDQILKSENDQNSFATKTGKTNVHVSIWRQKNRVRVYVNQEKIWDIPRAFAEGVKISSLYFRNDGTDKDEDAYFISNLRVAVGAPDTRNKLLTEGKFVTRGILFDVNSDKIRPESYGVVKEIANVLSENEDVKIKIVGHTDSDGDDASNMVLSKKRAEAVKKMLSSQFNIDAGRMTTDGKGESVPVDSNNTSEGKANNRRVEFIKM